MRLKQLSFEQLAGFHPKLDVNIKVTSQLIYTAKCEDFCPAGLEKMLLLYPIHVTRQRNDDNVYDVVAGLRQYELLCVFHALQNVENSQHSTKFLQTIQVIEHDKLAARQIHELASCDIAGSALLFSLGTKVVAQLEIIKNSLDPKIVEQFPKFNSGRRMADRGS